MERSIVAIHDRECAERTGERHRVSNALDVVMDMVLHPDAHMVGFVFIAIDMSFRFEWIQKFGPVHYILVLFHVE